MRHADWRQLIQAFVERRIDERTLHERFFELWHASPKTRDHLPPAIEELFYVVEAYCPDPELRDPGSAYEADDAELRDAAETALGRLPAPSRFRMFLSRMRP